MPKRKKSELPVIKKGANGDFFCYKDGKKVYLARDEEKAKEKLVRMLEAEIALGEDAKHSQVRSIAVDRIPAGTVVRVVAIPAATRDCDIPLAVDEPRRRRDRPGTRLDEHDADLRPLRD